MSRARILNSFKTVAYYGGGLVAVAYAGQTFEKKHKKFIHSSTDVIQNLTPLDQTLKHGFSKFSDLLMPTVHCAHAFDAYMLQMTLQEFEAKNSTELYEIFKGRLGTDFGPHKPLHFFIVGQYNDITQFLPLNDANYNKNLVETDYTGKGKAKQLRSTTVIWLPEKVNVIKLVWNREAEAYDFFIGRQCHVLIEVVKTGGGNNIIVNPVKILTAIGDEKFTQQKMASGKYYISPDPMWLLKHAIGAFHFHKRSTPPPP